MYNSFLKVVFIACSSAIVYIIRFKSPQKDTWNPELDNFPIQYLIGPCAVAGLLINQDWTPFEMIWAFSIYLEAVAILPQLFLLQKQGEVENLTSHYVAALGAYRGLYLMNWVYRYFTEDDYLQRIAQLRAALDAVRDSCKPGVPESLLDVAVTGATGLAHILAVMKTKL